MNQFGEKIKLLRALNGFLQREVAHQLNIDAPMLSKIENGERPAKREQVTELSKLFNVSEEDLISLWVADRVYDIVKDEPAALKALKICWDQIPVRRK